MFVGLLHIPISTLFPYTTLFRSRRRRGGGPDRARPAPRGPAPATGSAPPARPDRPARPRSRRSEEHTSELQSLRHLVCRLLLEKKKNLRKLELQRTT